MIPDNSSQLNEHVMYAMSDLVKHMHFEFQVGLSVCANNYGVRTLPG
jgi:hypothetical protein